MHGSLKNETLKNGHIHATAVIKYGVKMPYAYYQEVVFPEIYF